MNLEHPITEADLIKKLALEKMSPHDKWNEVLRLREAAWQLKRAFVREQHPDWTPDQVENAVSKIFLYATT